MIFVGYSANAIAEEGGNPPEQGAAKAEGGQGPEVEVELSPDDAVTKLWYGMPTIVLENENPSSVRLIEGTQPECASEALRSARYGLSWGDIGPKAFTAAKAVWKVAKVGLKAAGLGTAADVTELAVIYLDSDSVQDLQNKLKPFVIGKVAEVVGEKAGGAIGGKLGEKAGSVGGEVGHEAGEMVGEKAGLPAEVLAESIYEHLHETQTDLKTMPWGNDQTCGGTITVEMKEGRLYFDAEGDCHCTWPRGISAENRLGKWGVIGSATIVVKKVELKKGKVKGGKQVSPDRAIVTWGLKDPHYDVRASCGCAPVTGGRIPTETGGGPIEVTEPGEGEKVDLFCRRTERCGKALDELEAASNAEEDWRETTHEQGEAYTKKSNDFFQQRRDAKIKYICCCLDWIGKAHNPPENFGPQDADKWIDWLKLQKGKNGSKQWEEVVECFHTLDRAKCPCPSPTPTPAAARTPAPPEGGNGRISTPPHTRTTMVMLVIPADRRPGELITGRLVEHGDQFKSMPGLSVVAVKVPVHEGHRGRAVLHGVVIDTDTARNQPADGPITMTVPAAPSIPLVLALTDAPTERTRVEVPSKPATPPPYSGAERIKQEPAMMPVIPDGGVCLIKGKFRGDGGATRVSVNDTPVAIVAESPREVYFQPPATIAAGKNVVTIVEGARRSTFDLFVPHLSIAAGQTVLRQDESTNIWVTATGFAGMRAGEWAPGRPSEITNFADVERNAPGSTAGGGSGALLLILQNDSPNTFRLNGATGNVIVKTIRREDLQNGAARLDATGTATEPGTLELEAMLIPMLGDASPTRVEEISNNTETEGGEKPPGNSNKTQEKEKKKDEGKTDDQGKGFEYLKNFFSGNAPELDDPKIQDYLRTREKLKEAKTKEKAARDASQKLKDAVVASDPQVKELQAEVNRYTTLVNNPMADPQGKQLYQDKLNQKKKDLANAKANAGTRWNASKQGQDAGKDVHAAENGVRDAQSALDKAGEGLDQDTKAVLDNAEDEAEKNPPPNEAQERVEEPKK